jgi:leucyl-tRNA synthetase
LAPYDQTTPWSPEAVAGTYRFLNRFWNLAQAVQLSNRQTNSSRAAKTIVARTIKKVTDDLAKMNYNTAIAALMEAQNQLSRLSPAEISPGDLADLTQLLAPFAPHITEEIWRQTLGHTKSIHISAWPKYAEKYLVEDQISLAIQVNGKLRAEITVAADTPPTEIEQLALSESKVTKFIGQQKPSRVIYVPGKIVNIVV